MRILATLAGAAIIGSVLVAGDATGSTEPEAADVSSVGRGATFTTIFPAPLGIEGLTGDQRGNLYAAARGGNPCPVWRVPSGGGASVVVGNIPAPCNPAGAAFDAAGRLYVANNGEVHVLTPDAANPPTSTVFATAVPGANGLAFDRSGALWVSDGGTGQGRVWKVGADGTPVEIFRVQPMVNEVNVVNGVGGVGRDPRGLPPGQVTITPNGRSAADTAGSQHLVANGIAFTTDGSMVVADTARGAIWRVRFDRDGALRSPTGCDTTFSSNTLCLNNIVIQHPYLDGADGIVLDRANNIWVAANERNAIVLVTARGEAIEVFRNAPDTTTMLRNGGPMEFPTSPFISDRRLCVTHSDGSRRDNFPNTGGEATPTGAVRAKISCLDQRLPVPGLPLPVR